MQAVIYHSSTIHHHIINHHLKAGADETRRYNILVSFHSQQSRQYKCDEVQATDVRQHMSMAVYLHLAIHSFVFEKTHNTIQLLTTCTEPTILTMHATLL